MKSQALHYAIAVAACLIGASPASAEGGAPVAVASSAAFAKTDAILGGAPSRLAAILAQQAGLPASPPLRPALSNPSPRYSELTPADPLRVRARSGEPDIFGSVALAVGSTSLDRRWRAVADRRASGAPARYAASLKGLDQLEQLDRINRFVNARVRFTDDIRQFGQADHWLSADETLRRGRGDCEDYAIAKYQLLRAAGVRESDMYVAVVKDLVRRADHAILVVRTADRMLVLDNGTDVIFDAQTTRDYRPVLTFAAAGRWTHGYRKPAASVAFAAASVAPLAPAAAPTKD